MTPCSLLDTVSEQPSVSVITVELQVTGFYALVPVYQTRRYHVPDVSYSACVFKKSMTLQAFLVFFRCSLGCCGYY
jgi:hypothetical protein